MRYATTGAAAAAVLLAVMAPAGAQSPPMGYVNWGGPYVGLNVGGEWSKLGSSVSVAPTPAGTLPGSAAIPGSSISFGGGAGANVTGGGQVGYNWQFNNLVVGVEGDIRGGGPSHSTTLGALPAGTANFVTGDSFRASSSWNASVRGRIGYAWDPVLIYATGGVAFADASIKANFVPTTAGGLAFPGSSGSASSTLIGPTVGGGLEYAVTPNISVGGEYRYTDYGSKTYNLGQLATVGVGPATAPTFATEPVSGKVSMRDNTVLFKVNYRFNAPPPPPVLAAMPAPPPPPAPKVFIVFFDWDRDTITPQGMAVIQQAADAYKSGAPAVQIQVTGYTDRSGSANYNQRLSERRANNVARAMAGMGVPQSQMAINGRGENDNRVPTADGVREPQNRRVEITF
jgi:outer membrane protein OmpA-like peptidoglycan-associated protein